jgi:RNA polymerase sigma-54 factor
MSVTSAELELTYAQEPAATQTMKVSPRLVAANHILQLSSLELQEAIAEEVNDNPALEQIEVATCSVCGSEMSGSICPLCIQRQRSSEGDSAFDGPAADWEPGSSARERLADEDEFDALSRVASEQTLAERLLIEMGAALPDEDMPIAEYVVGSLDEQGYLSLRPEHIAYELSVDEERVRHVVRVLQAQDPVGIGAANLRECLLLQLAYLEGRGVRQPYAREIVGQFLTELGEHKFGRIAHELHISTQEVEQVWEFVKEKLNPHPAHGFSRTNASDRDTRAMYIVPDVVISNGPDGFEVEVVESKRYLLRVNSTYAQLAAAARCSEATMSPAEKRHIQEYVGRARVFIASVNQRRQTLLNITQCLVDAQRDFLEHGVRHLKPLSRAAIAQRLGVHESTVSRATASKYVMLPSGEVVPYSHFFTPSLSIKDVLKEVIEREGKLTDRQIVERLEQRGITIARRTVAKYRAQLAILRSSLR